MPLVRGITVDAAVSGPIFLVTYGCFEYEGCLYVGSIWRACTGPVRAIDEILSRVRSGTARVDWVGPADSRYREAPRVTCIACLATGLVPWS